MARGEAISYKVHYPGKEEDFLIFVDSEEDYKKWQGDKSVPLAQVVSSFKIFVTHKQGAQGSYDGASKQVLENQFGTADEDDIIKQILEKGSLQEAKMSERQGPKNDSNGPMAAH